MLYQTLETKIKATASQWCQNPNLPLVNHFLLVQLTNISRTEKKRKCNLIIYNLSESNASSVKDWTQQDKKVFSQLVSSELKIDNINLLKCIGLGKNNRPCWFHLLKPLPNIISSRELANWGTVLHIHITRYDPKREKQLRSESRIEKTPVSWWKRFLTIRQGKIVQKVATNMDSES